METLETQINTFNEDYCPDCERNVKQCECNVDEGYEYDSDDGDYGGGE